MHIEQHFARLPGVHTAIGKTAPVAHNLDLTVDGRIESSGPQEIGVAPVCRPSRLCGPARCNQRLCQKLSAKYAAHGIVWQMRTAECSRPKLFEMQYVLSEGFKDVALDGSASRPGSR